MRRWGDEVKGRRFGGVRGVIKASMTYVTATFLSIYSYVFFLLHQD